MPADRRCWADHNWNALTRNAAGGLDPFDTGFEGYGTWTTTQNSPSSAQFNLLKITDGGAYYFPAFTDTGRLMLDPGGLPTEYVRIQ